LVREDRKGEESSFYAVDISPLLYITVSSEMEKHY